MTTRQTFKTENLRETIRAISISAEHDRAAEVSRAEYVSRAESALSVLHRKIEEVYLLEFLIFGVIEIAKRERRSDSSRVTDLVIRIGAEKIILHTIMNFWEDRCLRVQLRNVRHDGVEEFRIDVRQDDAKWQAVYYETGFRGLVRRYIPKRFVELDEEMFKDALHRNLLGPQPVFSIGRSHITNGLSSLLDYVTSDQVRRSLALGLKSGSLVVTKQVIPTLAAGLPKGQSDESKGEGMLLLESRGVAPGE